MGLFCLRRAARRRFVPHHREKFPEHVLSHILIQAIWAFSPVLAANPLIPWNLSDANCTAGSAENELFTTTVSAGGGTAGLTSPVGCRCGHWRTRSSRQRPSPERGFDRSSDWRRNVYIPISQPRLQITAQLVIGFPPSVNVWQAGNMTFNLPLIVGGAVNWSGESGVGHHSCLWI